MCLAAYITVVGRRRKKGGYEDLELPDDYSRSGIIIHMWSSDDSFPVFPFIVDSIDGLIEEWFPGQHFLNRSGAKSLKFIGGNSGPLD